MRNQGEIEVAGLSLQVFDLSVAALCLPRGEIALDVLFAAGQHGVDQPGELVGSELHGACRVHASSPSAVRRADRGFAIASGAGRHA